MSRPFAFSSLLVNNHLIGVTGDRLYINGVDSTVYQTGDQTISGNKTFAAEVVSVGFNGYYLKNPDNLGSINVYSQTLYDASNVESIIWNERHLKDTDGVQTVMWNDRLLVNSDLGIAHDWQNGVLYNLGQSPSLNHAMCVLINSGQQIVANWSDRILSGNWSSDTNPTGSGNLVNKGYLDLSASVIIKSNKIDFKTTGATAISTPSYPNHRFYVDSWSVVVSDISGIASGVSGMPIMAFGDSNTNYSGFLTGQRVSGGFAGARSLFWSPQNGMTGQLGFRITSSASGVAGSYMSGFCVYNGSYLPN